MLLTLIIIIFLNIIELILNKKNIPYFICLKFLYVLLNRIKIINCFLWQRQLRQNIKTFNVLKLWTEKWYAN